MPRTRKYRKRGEKWPQSEVQMAEPLVKWLKMHKHWDVYQEVSFNGYTADIVVVDTLRPYDLYWVIECKRSMNLQLLGQCHNWIRHAHHVCAAVPEPWKTDWRVDAVVRQWCISSGVGILHVPGPSSHHTDPYAYIKPRLNRNAVIDDWKKKYLSEEGRDYCKAGSPTGSLTPFKRTVIRLIDEVNAHGLEGIEMAELVKNVNHHYGSTASAKRCLVDYIVRGIIPEVIAKHIKGKFRIFPNPKFAIT